MGWLSSGTSSQCSRVKEKSIDFEWGRGVAGFKYNGEVRSQNVVCVMERSKKSVLPAVHCSICSVILSECRTSIELFGSLTTPSARLSTLL